MAYSFTPPTRLPGTVQALLGANRLEARPRSPEFNRALRAEVRDPTWLLARQWQMREFRAEDRGAPAYTEVTLREQPLSGLIFPGQDTRFYSPATQPLEAAVEAQPRPIGAGLRLQMGQYWLRLLRTLPQLASALSTTDQAPVLGIFAKAFGLAMPTPVDYVAYAQSGTTPEVAAVLALAGEAAVDGYELYTAILQPFAAQLKAFLTDSDQLAKAIDQLPLTKTLLSYPGIAMQTASVTALVQAVSGDFTAFDRLARQFVLAFHRLYLLGHDSPSWSNENMAYAFALGTDGTQDLGTTHYPGGAALPWYAVDQQLAPTGTPLAPPIATTTQRRLATGVQFPGAPATRWWEFEDRRVDFGQVTGDAADWGRMLLQEFMFLYQNDWLSVPYTVKAGTLCALEAVRVIDVFGRTYALQAAGAGQRSEPTNHDQLIDNDGNRWRLFAQTDLAATGAAPVPQLYVPASVRSPLVSRPVEQVSFRREEATNLVWAVESVISDGFAGGVDGASAAAQTTEALRRLAPAVTTNSGSAGAYTYQLASTVPENWVPFVPATDEAGRLTLAQGALPRQVPGLQLPLVQPRTILLQGDLSQPYYLHEHEVPPAGVRVDGLCYRARWYDGRTLHWFGRQRGPAQSGGSSGLAFDQLYSTNPT
jgi:hypothetical protein